MVYYSDFESDYSGNNLGYNTLKSRIFESSGKAMFSLSLGETKEIGKVFRNFHKRKLKDDHGFRKSNEIINGYNITIEKETRNELVCDKCMKKPRVGLLIGNKKKEKRLSFAESVQRE